VGVADVDHGAGDVADAGKLDGAGHDAGYAHFAFDEVVWGGSFNDLAGADAAVGSEGDRLEAFALGKPCGDAAGAVAGELGFAAVGVEEAEEEFAVGAAIEEFDAVGADAGVAGAEFAGEVGVAALSEVLFDDSSSASRRATT
jgi:hypothetical protein